MKYGFTGEGMPYFTVDADTYDEAVQVAEEHFALHLESKSGRWKMRDEGEDENCQITFELYEWETPLCIVSFQTAPHSEDRRVVGVFSNKEKARERIQHEIEMDHSQYPERFARSEQDAKNYHIDEFYLDE